MNIVIRREIESDVQAISEVTRSAFENHPYSNQTEEFIINALRDSKALTISLVAVAGKKVVGHIAFSPVTISDGSPGWYGLGPISVLPELQKQGIGKSLIREGLSLLKIIGCKGLRARRRSWLLQTVRLQKSPGLGHRRRSAKELSCIAVRREQGSWCCDIS